MRRREKLKNGAEVVGFVECDDGRGRVVLARWKDDEEVSWVVDNDGNAYWGRYGVEARPAFLERLARYCHIRPPAPAAPEQVPWGRMEGEAMPRTAHDQVV